MKAVIHAIGTTLWCIVVFPLGLIMLCAIHALNALAGDAPDPDEHD